MRIDRVQRKFDGGSANLGHKSRLYHDRPRHRYPGLFPGYGRVIAALSPIPTRVRAPFRLGPHFPSRRWLAGSRAARGHCQRQAERDKVPCPLHAPCSSIVFYPRRLLAMRGADPAFERRWE
jgi:hypothetical protein